MATNKFRIYYISNKRSEYLDYIDTMKIECRKADVSFDRSEVEWIHSRFLLTGRMFKSRHELALGPSWREVADIDFINSRITGDKFDPAIANGVK